MVLENVDLSVIVSWIGTIMGFILNIAPIVQFFNIFRGKEKIDIVPELMLVFNILCSELWSCYWLRQNIFVPFFSAAVGLGLSEIFAIIYLYFYGEKIVGKFLIYVLIESGLVYGFYYLLVFVIPTYQTVGTIAMVVNILTYIAPGQNIIKVIKQRNYKLISIASTIVGAACSLCWFSFGLMIKDINTIIPNSIGLTFSLINTFVWIYFYLNRKDEEEGEKETELVDKDKN